MTNPAAQPPQPPSRGPDDARDLVDRLVDGTLDNAGRVQLARAMGHDPALERDARELEGINTNLKSFFAPAVAASLASSAASSSTPTVDRTPMSASSRPAALFSRRAALGLLAACLLIGGVVIGLMMSGGGPSGWAHEARDLYRSIEAAGFKPQVVCTTPEQFAQWTGDNIGEAMTPQVGVAGLELVGWNTATTFSPYTGVLIAKVEGRGVIVLLDQAALVEAEGIKVLGDGLRAFPGMIGKVGAVEVTPFDSARVIPTIKLAKP